MNIIERKSGAKGTAGKLSSTKGKFVESMRSLAKKRSKSRSKAPLQVGNVLTKKAPMGGKTPFTSNLAHGDDSAGITAKPEKDNLNDGQQGGKSTKKKGSF